MYPIEHKLSRLRYTNEDANLQLESICSLKLSSHQKPSVSSTESKGLLAFLDATEASVVRGNGLSLCIHLTLNQACISNNDRQALVEYLAILVQDTKVVPLYLLLYGSLIDSCVHSVMARNWLENDIDHPILNPSRQCFATGFSPHFDLLRAADRPYK